MSARTRKDWILWGALGCALVGTAHAEYTLATAAHFHPYVAVVVPGALDLYVIRALQQRRDVFVAVLAMVAANVAAHLIQAGVLAVNWQVIAAVGAVAPLIVWRVYSLKYTRTQQELLWEVPAGAMSAPAPETAECGCLNGVRCTDHCDCRECASGAVHSELYPDEVQVYPAAPDWNEAARVRWVEMGLGAPDHVPADWMDAEYPETHPSAPNLRSVPDLPAEYAPGAVHSESPLREDDLPFLPGAQEYVDQTERPSVRGLKKALGIGLERAERLLTHLGVIL